MGEEFDQTTTTSQGASTDANFSGVTEAERLEASTRQITLTPMHDDVVADDLPDEQIATQHILQPAIANIPTDSEHTLPAIKQRAAVRTHRFALAVSLAAVSILTTVSLLAFFG